MIVCAPGTIEAENFNNGGSYVGYYAATTGNQGNSNYRSGVDVDLYTDGTNTYIQSSSAKEYAKYTFSVANAGWYSISYVAKQISGNSFPMVTLIDDRQFGASQSIPVQSEFAAVSGVEAAYLTVGQHTLTVSFLSSGTALDKIQIAAIPAPQLLTPKVVDSPLSTDEIVIADAVVTDSPYNADNMGTADSTEAIQNALDDVARMGGGTVFIPAGIYKINGNLVMKNNVTLRGDWQKPFGSGNGAGTILKVKAGKNDENDAAFITMIGSNTTVRNLSVWYPDQSASKIKPFPYTIAGLGYGHSVMNITLYNSYDGIRISGGSSSVVSNIYGTILHQGIDVHGGWEYSYLYNVYIKNEIWENAPLAVITNAPVSTTAKEELENYTGQTMIGVQLGQNDGYEAYNVNVEDAAQGVLVKKDSSDDHAFYGALSKIQAPIHEVDTYPGLHFINADRIPQTASLSYTFAANRKPTGNGFYNVKTYGAVGDGIADDTAAIQNALHDAGTAGGGVVYLPQGQYKVLTHLNVPSGVELRGPYGGPHGSENVDTAVLLAYEGKDTGNPYSDTAFISLEAHSGVRGFDIVYPEQGYGSSFMPVRPYPYTIRSKGSGVGIVDMNLENAYNAIDFSTFRSDDHLVQGLWATAFNIGVVVSNNTSGGVIERSNITYGNWFQSYRYNSPHNFGQVDIVAYTKNHTQAYMFGGSDNERTFGLNSFNSLYAVRFINDFSGSPQNYMFWLPSSDTSKNAGFNLESGFTAGDLKMIGVQAGGNEGYGTESSGNFAGHVNIYDILYWAWPNGGAQNIQGGAVDIYTENGNLAVGKSVSMNATPYVGHEAEKAVDGTATTYAQSNSSAPWSLTVDLGTSMAFNKVAFTPDTANYASKYTIEVSDDNQTWSMVATETGGGGTPKSYIFPLANARYVKLIVTGTVGTSGHAVREFEVYKVALNLAAGNSASMDAEPFTGYGADKAVDGNLATYAQSNSVTPWNLTVDLGQTTTFNKVVYTPDSGNYASTYTIDISNDNVTWSTVASETAGVGTPRTYTFSSVNARYVKLHVIQTVGAWGHAIREFEVYNSADSS